MSSIKLSPAHGVNPAIPVCFWCGQDKNEVALLGKIDKEDSAAPYRIVMDYEPCEKCKELFNKGIHVIGVSEQPLTDGMFPIIQDDTVTLYPTGSMFVATENWAERFLTANGQPDMIADVLEKKVLVMPDAIVSEIVKESKAQEMEVQLPEDNTEEGE